MINPMIAAMPMYDRPETRAPNDRLWKAIRENYGAGPDALTRDMDLMTLWRAPNLLLAQTCGLPFRAMLHDKVTLVGTPDYGVPGCPIGHYNSVFVVHNDSSAETLADIQNRPFAYNEPMSQSGWAAPYAHTKAMNLRLSNLVKTGSHIETARAVSTGRATCGALDCVTWRLIQRYDDFGRNLRVIDTTAPTPGLPFITANPDTASNLFSAFRNAIAQLRGEDRAILMLHGFNYIPPNEYLELPIPPTPEDSLQSNAP